MVGAANNFEVEAGFRILTQGGNAVVLEKTPSSHHAVILYAAVLQAK